MTNSCIRVYLTKEIIGWIIGKNGWRIKEIGEDTNTSIFHVKAQDSYFRIQGELENTHRARIILQDLEKDFYREEYLEHIDKNRRKINKILDDAEKSLHDLNMMSSEV